MTYTHVVRSNRALFFPFDAGSPRHDLFEHISGLGPLRRRDFEEHSVAGEIIFRVETDHTPTSREDEEARIGTLAYALKKLGDAEMAAEFIRHLNAICEEGDARSRQTTAGYYYKRITEAGALPALIEMGELAQALSALNASAEATDEEESDEAISSDDSDGEEPRRPSAFEIELASICSMARRSHASQFIHDDLATYLDGLEESGASVEELDAAFAWHDNLDQYDENGAILMMSSTERTVSCGSVDDELTEDDLPFEAAHLAAQIRKDFASGVEIGTIWDEIEAQLGILFPTNSRRGKRDEQTGRETTVTVRSQANAEWRALSRRVLEQVMAECQADFHLRGLRHNREYRKLHRALRTTRDTRQVSEIMKGAFALRTSEMLPLSLFTALVTAAKLQRARLERLPLSQTALRLIREINAASERKLRFLKWAMYGENKKDHPIHTLSTQEQARIWQALKAR